MIGKLTAPVFFRKFLLLTLLLILVSYAPAESSSSNMSRLNEGIELYSQGRWLEAALEFRRVQAEASSKEIRGEALFWISISELFAGEYEQALRDMDALVEIDPESPRIHELPYHRGRVLYCLGHYDDAIVLLKGYADSINVRPGSAFNSGENLRKAAALYWTGECLYSLGQMDKAYEIFRYITEEHAGTPKYEASVYRIALINRKKVETELLNLLKLSHEEALKNMEEYHRKETFYDQALSAYQRRLADMVDRPEYRLQELENENARFRQQLSQAEERIRTLEGNVREPSSSEDSLEPDQAEKLRGMQESARELERVIGGGL